MIEKTLVLLQRDAVEKKLVGEIVSRFEKAGLKIVAMRSETPDRKMAEKHYRATDEQIVGMGNKTLNAMKEQGKEKNVMKIFGTEDPRKIGEQLLEWSRDYITKGVLIALVLEGENAIKKVRELVGFTDPAKAAPGTIRGDFKDDSITKANEEKRKVRNLIHAADSPDSAQKEIELWFGKNI